MKAEQFYKMHKRKNTMENEYFIAMDKLSFFKMMEDFANHKNVRIRGDFNKQTSEENDKIFAK